MRRTLRKQRRTKKTRGRGLFGPNQCGKLNPNKTYSDNRRNCLRNKDKWAAAGVKDNGIDKKEKGYPITCKRHQVEDINFPSNPECVNDIIEKDFYATAEDDQYDGNNGLMF